MSGIRGKLIRSCATKQCTLLKRDCERCTSHASINSIHYDHTHCYVCDKLIEIVEGYDKKNHKKSWEASHIIADSLKGNKELHNMRICCIKCNRRMYTNTPCKYALEKGLKKHNSLAVAEKITSEDFGITVYRRDYDSGYMSNSSSSSCGSIVENLEINYTTKPNINFLLFNKEYQYYVFVIQEHGGKYEYGIAHTCLVQQNDSTFFCEKVQVFFNEPGWIRDTNNYEDITVTFLEPRDISEKETVRRKLNNCARWLVENETSLKKFSYLRCVPLTSSKLVYVENNHYLSFMRLTYVSGCKDSSTRCEKNCLCYACNPCVLGECPVCENGVGCSNHDYTKESTQKLCNLCVRGIAESRNLRSKNFFGYGYDSDFASREKQCMWKKYHTDDEGGRKHLYQKEIYIVGSFNRAKRAYIREACRVMEKYAIGTFLVSDMLIDCFMGDHWEQSIDMTGNEAVFYREYIVSGRGSDTGKKVSFNFTMRQLMYQGPSILGFPEEDEIYREFFQWKKDHNLEPKFFKQIYLHGCRPVTKKGYYNLYYAYETCTQSNKKLHKKLASKNFANVEEILYRSPDLYEWLTETLDGDFVNKPLFVLDDRGAGFSHSETEDLERLMKLFGHIVGYCYDPLSLSDRGIELHREDRVGRNIWNTSLIDHGLTKTVEKYRAEDTLVLLKTTHRLNDSDITNILDLCKKTKWNFPGVCSTATYDEKKRIVICLTNKKDMSFAKTSLGNNAVYVTDYGRDIQHQWCGIGGIVFDDGNFDPPDFDQDETSKIVLNLLIEKLKN